MKAPRRWTVNGWRDRKARVDPPVRQTSLSARSIWRILTVGFSTLLALLTILIALQQLRVADRQLKLSDRLTRLEYSRSRPKFSISETRSESPTRGAIRDVEKIEISASNGVDHVSAVRSYQMFHLGTQVRGQKRTSCRVIVRGYFIEHGTMLRRSRPGTFILGVGRFSGRGGIYVDWAPSDTILDVSYEDIFGGRRFSRLRYRDGQVSPLSQRQISDIDNYWIQVEIGEPSQNRMRLQLRRVPTNGVTEDCKRAMSEWDRILSLLTLDEYKSQVGELPQGW